ncbi:MAG: hypothetical protein HKO84_02960 [Pseudomonadales bacterium]|nr:hypothetical protein [Pseudomonadales bacterium]
MKIDSEKPVFIGSRQALASALGIDYWVARRRLAGAPANQHIVALRSLADAIPAPAQDADLAAAAANRHGAVDAQASAAEAPAAVATGSAAREKLLQQRTQLGAAAGQPAPVQQASGHQTKKIPPHDALRFEIASVTFGSLLIADDVTGLSLTRSTYLSWLQSLAFAMQAPARDAAATKAANANGAIFNAANTNAAIARLAWPPDNSLPSAANATDLPGQRSAAAEMLSAWLRRQAQDVGIERILLMGDAPRLLAGEAASHGELLQLALFPRAKVCVTHGSNRLWREPALKRELWQHLQPLI